MASVANLKLFLQILLIGYLSASYATADQVTGAHLVSADDEVFVSNWELADQKETDRQASQEPGGEFGPDSERIALSNKLSSTEEAGSESKGKPFLLRYQQTLLDYYLKRSTHAPVCILFAENGFVSELEKKVSVLWRKLSTHELFANWQLGVLEATSRPLKSVSRPEKMPSLRCYVGTAMPEDYSGKHGLKEILQWFKAMVRRYRHRITEASLESLREAVEDESRLTMVAFPGEDQHYEIEWLLLELKSAHPDGLRLFVVHPGSSHKGALHQKFGITVEPTIVVLKKKDRHLRVWQRFAQPFATQRFLEPFVVAQTSSATSLTVHNFQQEVFSRRDSPILVCFYTHWAEQVVSYLQTFITSGKELEGLGARLRFGVVDVEAQQDIVPRWLNAPGIKGMPFSVLFWREASHTRGKGLQQTPLPEGDPTPTAIGTFLIRNNITLIDVNGGSFHFPVWETSYDMEVSMGVSSLVSPTCIMAVNTSLEGVTDVWSEGPSGYEKKLDEKETASVLSISPSAESPDSSRNLFNQLPKRELPQIGSIPQVTDTRWAQIIDQSHTDMQGEDLQLLMTIHAPSIQKDSPQTKLVFFIQDGCGSCRRQQAMFERVTLAISFVEGGSAYILNCTSDPLTCDRLGVRGFPTLIAFRTFGQHSSERCLSHEHHEHTLRMDFHGVMEEKAVMEWFSDIASPRVQIRSQMEILDEQKHNNVIVQATIYPQSLAGQYLRSVGGVRSWYPLQCFQVACERLYGKARCFAAYGENIKLADRQRTSTEETLIVGMVDMMRQDGIRSRVITSGKFLIAALQAEADSQIHRFHTPHKYKLRSGQRCEDDHAACTDLITDFVEDHSRLPVTHLTRTSFHAYSSVGFDSRHKGSVFKSGLPVLIAMAHKDQMEEGSPFQEALLTAAYDLYQDLVMTWVDVDEFPRWVARFLPVYYQRLVLEHEAEITDEYLPSLFVYPRLCIVRTEDHRHAAFFPSARGFSLTSKFEGRTIDKQDILWFAQQYLNNPDEIMMETDHF